MVVFLTIVRQTLGKWVLSRIKKATPAIQSRLNTMLNIMENEAKLTTNPWDDILVDILKAVVGKK